jgi:ubiquinone/menaquinone biosynthesis C-methylase UbiE
VEDGRTLPGLVTRAEPDDDRAFKDFEAAGWSANAAGYDALTGRVTARVAERLLDAAGVRPGVRVLDVGCGLGRLCAAAAARGATPTGVDLADGMVAAARRLHPAFEFRQADAEALPFAGGSFDAVLAAFLVNHVPRPERAAAELCRVVAPGGRVAVAMWDRPERVAFLGLFDEAMREAAVRTGAAVPPGPSAYRFADDGELRGLLEGAGLDAATVHDVAFPFEIRDAAELWDGVQTGSVRTAAQLRALPEPERARVREALERLLESRRGPDGGLVLETAVKIAVGVRPGG